MTLAVQRPIGWRRRSHAEITGRSVKAVSARHCNQLWREHHGAPARCARFYQLIIPVGRTVGGSSSINGMIINRGQADDFNNWAQRGNAGWGYADLLPYFKRFERRIGGGDNLYRGRHGNIPVTDLDWQDEICERLSPEPLASE